MRGILDESFQSLIVPSALVLFDPVQDTSQQLSNMHFM